VPKTTLRRSVGIDHSLKIRLVSAMIAIALAVLLPDNVQSQQTPQFQYLVKSFPWAQNISFSRDGSLIVLARGFAPDGSSRHDRDMVWLIESRSLRIRWNKVIGRPSSTGNGPSIGFSSDGAALLLVHEGGRVLTVSVRDGAYRAGPSGFVQLSGPRGCWNPVVCSADGSRRVEAPYNAYPGAPLTVYDHESGATVVALAGEIRRYGDSGPVGLSEGGSMLVFAAAGNVPTLIDANTGETLVTLPKVERLTGLAVRRADGLIASISQARGMLLLQDLYRGQEVMRSSSNRPDRVYFTPDGRWIVTREADSVRVWLPGFADSVNDDALREIMSPRDPFETLEEFSTRQGRALQCYLANWNAVVDSQMFETVRLRISSRKAGIVPAERVKLVRFDAERSEYHIDVDGTAATLSMSVEDARALRQSMGSIRVEAAEELGADLVDSHVVDRVLVHPVTGNRYPFGRRGLTAASRGNSEAASMELAGNLCAGGR